jgi:hypothetical protein
MSRSRPICFAVVAFMALLGLTSCSDDNAGDDGSSDPPGSVNVTEKAGSMDPVGEVVKAKTGQQITLVVSSDADDEIHVHSSPEHEFEVKAGDTRREFHFSVKVPGTIPVESHGLDVTILKLEVS